MDKGFLNKGSASKTDRKGNHSAKGNRASDVGNVNDQATFDMDELVARMKRIKGNVVEDTEYQPSDVLKAPDHIRKDPVMPVLPTDQNVHISDGGANMSISIEVEQANRARDSNSTSNDPTQTNG